MKKTYKKTAEVAALAGTIMLESHAESYRVEDTVRRILQTSGLSITEVISTTTGLFITLDDPNPEIEGITLVRRIKERSNQLNKIYRVNNISRQLTSKAINLDEAYEKLMVVDEAEYSVFRQDIAIILLVMGFAYLLDGSLWDILISSIIGAVVAYSRVFRESFQLNGFINGILTTFATAFITNLIASIIPIPLNSDTIVIAALMPLYPGTAFTNGIRDMLKGDYVSGVARVSDALIIAVSLAIGVAMGLYIFQEVGLWLSSF